MNKTVVEEIVYDELPTFKIEGRFMNFIEIGFRVSDPFVNVLALESIFNFIEIYKLFVLLKNIELDLWKVFVIKLRQGM